jgi:hypothetical protein
MMVNGPNTARTAFIMGKELPQSTTVQSTASMGQNALSALFIKTSSFSLENNGRFSEPHPRIVNPGW